MKQFVVALCVVPMLCSSFLTSAGIITFTDRSLFESYINDFVVDELNGISIGIGSTLGRSRTGYSWTMNDYGCVNSSGCNIYGNTNPLTTPGNNWIWTYQSGSFDFDFGITAFGLNYANPFYENSAQLGLNNLLSGMQPNGSFFGIATTDGSTLSSISYQQYSSFLGIDNITYSTTANGIRPQQIPAPWPLAVFATGLVLLRLRRSKKAD